MPTQLLHIHQIQAALTLQTGLLIGAGDTEMHIGGADKTVQRHPHTREPFVPGSSLKGKVRSLLEWRAGVIGLTNGAPLGLKHLPSCSAGLQQGRAHQILRLFGFAPGDKDLDREASAIGPTRLAFWDSPMNGAWVAERKARNEALTEVKSENAINRISGVAEHPRFFERVPAGAVFDFRVGLKLLDGDNLDDALAILADGLKLLEMDGLGGQVSRGYGRVKLSALTLDGKPWRANLDDVKPFEDAA